MSAKFSRGGGGEQTHSQPSVYKVKIINMVEETNEHFADDTVVPTKSDSGVIFCSQLLSKPLTCTLHLS